MAARQHTSEDRTAPANTSRVSPKATDTTTRTSAATARHGPGPQAGTEQAKHGGMAVKAKYGKEYYAQIGAKGGKTARQRYGAEFYSVIGKQGGQATRQRLGTEHYERIGRLGGLRARQRERQAAGDTKESQ